MVAYNELYIASVMDAQSDLFLGIRDKLQGVDEKWFIERFMRSHVRAMLDIGNPKYVNAPPTELMLRFIEDECGNDYERGDTWGGFLPGWVGKAYALYQWKYNVSSKDLIERFPLHDMERAFPALHQMGWDAAVDRIHDILLQRGA